MRESELREVVVDTARAMNARGVNRGTSGNLSVRVPRGMLITPSAVPYEAMEPDDLVLMDLDGTVLDAPTARDPGGGGARRPSTEWRLHAGILSRRGDVHSVLHAHPDFATTLACLHMEIPAVHYMVAAAGGASIRCAAYATYGTAELAALALAALEDRTACLLANHGLVALGRSPRAALDLAVEVEALAGIYWRALQVGEPVVLSPGEMAEVLERFEDYRRGGPSGDPAGPLPAG